MKRAAAIAAAVPLGLYAAGILFMLGEKAWLLAIDRWRRGDEEMIDG